MIVYLSRYIVVNSTAIQLKEPKKKQQDKVLVEKMAQIGHRRKKQ
jgi:hypothetical protein